MTQEDFYAEALKELKKIRRGVDLLVASHENAVRQEAGVADFMRSILNPSDPHAIDPQTDHPDLYSRSKNPDVGPVDDD